MKKSFNLRTLILLALFAALCALFKAFMSFPITLTGIKTAEVSLAPIPVILAGIFFGPIAGGLVGFVGETAGFFIGIQLGGYNPIISAVMALYGIIAGLICIKTKKIKPLRLAILTAFGVICTRVFKILIVWLYYGVPRDYTISTQTFAALFELPAFIILIIVLFRSLRPLMISRLGYEDK